MSAFYDLSKTPRNILNQAIVRAIVSENNGAWFDPSDMSTMFQDAAGTTPVTAVEQPVGLMLDKARGLMLGPELVSNGTFDADTSWTKNTDVTISAGTCNFLAVAGGQGINQSISQSFSTDKKYLVEFGISSYSSGGGISVRLGNVGNFYPVTSSNGKKKLIINAGSTRGFVQFLETSGSGSYSIDNISIRELYGYHATQSITASRPTLSARYNLLTKTENLADAAWDKLNTTATPGYADPFSGMTANKIIESATNKGHQVQMQLGIGSASVAVFSVALKQAGRGWAIVQLKNSDASADAYAWVNLSTGEVGTKTGNPIIAVSSLSNGWYTVSVSKLLTSSSGWVVAVYPAIGDGVVVYQGDGTSGIYIWHPQLEYGPVATCYQRVNTATDYDTDPRYFPKYLQFSPLVAIDDYLNLPYMGLYGGGAASIVCARDEVSQATDTYIISERSTTDADPKYFPSRQLANAGNMDTYITDDAGAVVLDTVGSPFSGVANAVIRSVVDSGNNLKLFKNGTLAANDNYTRSGTLTLNTTTIGASVSTTTSNYSSMKLYGLIVTKSALTDAQRIACERYLGRKSGVQL